MASLQRIATLKGIEKYSKKQEHFNLWGKHWVERWLRDLF